MIAVNGRATRLHRLAAAVWLGVPITSKLLVMHLCEDPSCFNPEHLRGGTQKENMANWARRGRMTRTHCKRGHPLTPENVYSFARKDGYVMRIYRQCRRVRVRLFMRAKRHRLATSQRANLKSRPQE